ncbi:LOW QUALITY PROTEIN: BTB/POZ domain-containing protein 18 [Falco peregrinus]|uniref:LOW QUALITY PROTEIN: BTB/POZ domain-containing protein 18 n=1 Tax=Falco peregrinus TaxID=8954 RepID=UPI0024797C1D|nr:LOW QUALITY PROTEIN: BTB/POZ domain-containing protein 18 [Falco peregrinus]
MEAAAGRGERRGHARRWARGTHVLRGRGPRVADPPRQTLLGGRVPMGSPSATPRLLYRSTRLLRKAFQQLHQQQQRGDVFCDAVLQAEGEAVVAHCCVLSVCSPFFMEQLARSCPPQGCRVVLELGGLKIGALRKLVHFLYTAELEATQEEVQEVLAAARHLRVTELESLELREGRLVRLGPQRQLNRSCLRAPQHVSPVTVGHRAEPRVNAVPPCEGPRTQGTVQPSSVGRMKLRKVESWGCWEVVQERQPPTVPSTVAVSDKGLTEPQPPLHAGALGQAGGHSPPRRAWRKQGQVPPPPQQGCRQAVPLGDPLGDSDEEEVDVGTVEPCLPPSTVCVWPCPSSESDEEVDVLT